jgi:hypothetical protein
MALAHFQRTFTDTQGNVKPGLAVTVRRESDNGLAALFSDAGSVTPKSNPFNTDANGYGSFYVTDGRYRIQATDIDWRNEDLISQPSPNFTAMPQVGGDPIVESGSNADGEWTRWADGTQTIQTVNVTTNAVNIASGSIYKSGNTSVAWPISFNSTPAASGLVTGGLVDTVVAFGTGISTTSAVVVALRGVRSGAGVNLSMLAIGRWK